MKKSIYIFLLTIFLYSCKSLQKPAIVTSKQVAQKTGSYTFTEKTGLEKPVKPTKKELKAIEKAKHKAAQDSIEQSKIKVVVEEETPQDFTPTFEVSDYIKQQILNVAAESLGSPYRGGGTTPAGFDCSGFVSYVFKNFGLTLPRSSSGYKNLGKALKPEDFKVGDVLVFYGYKDRTVVGHLGIICEANGMQSKFIHASSGKAQKVTITALDTEHYTKRFYKCIDVLSE